MGSDVLYGSALSHRSEEVFIDFSCKDQMLKDLRTKSDFSSYSEKQCDDVLSHMTVEDKVRLSQDIIPFFGDIDWLTRLVTVDFVQGKFVDELFTVFSEYKNFSVEEIKFLMENSPTPAIHNLLRNKHLPLEFLIDNSYYNRSYEVFSMAGRIYMGAQTVASTRQKQLPRIIRELRDTLKQTTPEVDSLTDEMVLSVSGVTFQP